MKTSDLPRLFSRTVPLLFALTLLFAMPGCDEDDPAGPDDSVTPVPAAGLRTFPLATGNRWLWKNDLSSDDYLQHEVVGRVTYRDREAWKLEITHSSGPAETGYFTIINDSLFAIEEDGDDWEPAQPNVWLDGANVGDVWVLEDTDSTLSSTTLVSDSATVTANSVRFEDCLEVLDVSVYNSSSRDSFVTVSYYKPYVGLVYSSFEMWSNFLSSEMSLFLEASLWLEEYTVQ